MKVFCESWCHIRSIDSADIKGSREEWSLLCLSADSCVPGCRIWTRMLSLLFYIHWEMLKVDFIDERKAALITHYLLTDWHWQIISCVLPSEPSWPGASAEACLRGRSRGSERWREGKERWTHSEKTYSHSVMLSLEAGVSYTLIPRQNWCGCFIIRLTVRQHSLRSDYRNHHVEGMCVISIAVLLCSSHCTINGQIPNWNNVQNTKPTD